MCRELCLWIVEKHLSIHKIRKELGEAKQNQFHLFHFCNPSPLLCHQKGCWFLWTDVGVFCFPSFCQITEAILSCPENRNKWTSPNWPPNKLHPPWPLSFTYKQFSSWPSSGFVFIHILNGYLLNPCYVPGNSESHYENTMELPRDFQFNQSFSFRNMQKMSWTSVGPHSIKIFLYPYSA